MTNVMFILVQKKVLYWVKFPENNTKHADNEMLCYHCGTECIDLSIRDEEKVFCCQGCETVYAILKDNDLCKFYDLEQRPGIKRTGAFLEDEYFILKDETLATVFTDYKDNHITHVCFYLPAIHCSSCIWLLENLNVLDPGIISSRVDFPKKTVRVQFKTDSYKIFDLAVLLASIGYPPSLNPDIKAAKKKNDRSLIYRIGIAGFAFGNIMLLSFPEYLSGGTHEEAYSKFFGWFNLILSLPVLFYCSVPFIRSAYSAIKNSDVNIDVPLTLGIIALFGQSAYEIISGAGAGYMDSFAALIFFLLIGRWYQGKTYKALSFDRDYKSYFPLGVKVIEEGSENTKAIHSLKPGDRMIIRNGELIPADSILSKGKARIDYSFVTGEDDPVSHKEGDRIFAGGKQKAGIIELIVEKAVDQSYLTGLWNREVFSKERSDFLSDVMNKVSKRFTIAILLISLLSGIYWWMTDPSKAIFVIASILIIACPCALALSLPFALGNSMRVFGKNGLYLRSTSVIEKLAKIDEIIFDKTGTLTSKSKDYIRLVSTDLSQSHKQKISVLASQSIHPLSIAISEYLGHYEFDCNDFVEVTGQGIEGNIGGSKIRLGNANFTYSTKQDAGESASMVYVNIDDKPCGYFVINKVYRKNLDQVIQSLKINYKLHLLSGDNDSERAYFASLMGGDSVLNFNQDPEQKLDYIEELRHGGGSVMMVGDGLNDAGALKAADVGIAMSEDVHAFSPSCDAILSAGSFEKLPGFIQFAKQSMRVVKMSFVVSFLYNITGLSFASTGNLTPLIAAILMPLSSITVVGFVVLMTSLFGRQIERKDAFEESTSDNTEHDKYHFDTNLSGRILQQTH